MSNARLTISLLIAALSMSAHAETSDCTPITSLPYTISVQGIYCLTGNLSTSITSGAAIEIQNNNVTIDMNGYKLGGLGAVDGTQATGIYAYQRKNVTIKNGIVRGFYVGIGLEDDPPYTSSSGHVVENIFADQNTYLGIGTEGLGNTVRDNTVVDTGGSTLSVNADGIAVGGSGAKIANNAMSTTVAQDTGYSVGIYPAATDYSLVQNNTVTDTLRGTWPSYAISVGSSTGVFLRNNNLSNADYGVYMVGASGKYFNNLTYDIVTPFTGGTPVGSNNN